LPPDHYPITVLLTDDDTGVSKYLFEQVLIQWNYDDDDENDILDYLDPIGGPMENDLVQIDFTSFLQNVPNGSLDGALIIESNSNNSWHSSSSSCDGPSTDCPPIPVIRFWLDAEKTQPLFIDYTGTELPDNVTSIWVEGAQVGTETLFVSWRESNPYNGLWRINNYLGEVLLKVLGTNPFPVILGVKENYWGEKDGDAGIWHSPDDVLWYHNDHQWMLTIFGDLSLIEKIDYWAIPYESQAVIAPYSVSSSDPSHDFYHVNGQLFIQSPDADPVYGEPRIGDWVFVAVVKYSSSGSTQYATSSILRKPLLQATVAWEAAGNQNFHLDGNHTLPVDGDVFFPEANNPTDDPDATIGVNVTVTPGMPAGLSSKLYLYLTDPDNSLNGVGEHDWNDTNTVTKPNDNYASAGA